MIRLIFLQFLMATFLSFCVKGDLSGDFFFSLQKICSEYLLGTMPGTVSLTSREFFENKSEDTCHASFWVGFRASKVINN